MPCIYTYPAGLCPGTAPLSKKEHYLPRGLGNFKHDDRLANKICNDCQVRFSKLEDLLLHNSPEAFFREMVGQVGRQSVRVDRVESRNLTGLASAFTFELFSPHMDDMDSSNNSSIVLKLVGLDQNGFSYLITGDTESERWDNINRYFGKYLASDVMAAPHHGARTGLNAKTLLLVNPNTVLISAGVDHSYGHPSGVAVQAYQQVAKHVFCTIAEDGKCLLTRRIGDDFRTHLVQHFVPAEKAL